MVEATLDKLDKELKALAAHADPGGEPVPVLISLRTDGAGGAASEPGLSFESAAERLEARLRQLGAAPTRRLAIARAVAADVPVAAVAALAQDPVVDRIALDRPRQAI